MEDMKLSTVILVIILAVIVGFLGGVGVNLIVYNNSLKTQIMTITNVITKTNIKVTTITNRIIITNFKDNETNIISFETLQTQVINNINNIVYTYKRRGDIEVLFPPLELGASYRLFDFNTSCLYVNGRLIYDNNKLLLRLGIRYEF